MANISGISYSNLLRGITCKTTGTANGGTRAGASDAATTAANNSTPSTANVTGDYSNSTAYSVTRLGGFYGNKTTSIDTPYQDTSTGVTVWKCTWTATRIYYQSQILVTFTLPSGVTADNLGSATLTFTTSSDTNLTTSETCWVCAPASGDPAPSSYITHSNPSIIDQSSLTSFIGVGTKGYTYSVDIKNQLGQCIAVNQDPNNQSWLLITLPADSSYPYGWTDLTGVSITYTLAYSACGAPNSVSTNVSIQKPNGTVTVSWSGATAGTNNAITGYTIYWRIGAAPTTSTYTGSATKNSSPYSFSVPSTATRGAKYYFKIVTNGTVSGYNSSISSASASTTVNSLPGAPTVTVDKSRIKSTGSTTVKFTVTAGTDNDSSQTRTVWYNTDNSSWSGINCKKVPDDGKLSVDLDSDNLNNSITYYFRTWDGIEYCSGSTSKTITKNTPPTIGSITMSAYNNLTYAPSVTVSNVERSYVKNINGTASGVTGTNITYQWKLCVGSSSSTTSYGNVTNISTSTSLSNIDVTKYGANFNTAYKLCLVVTDDLGESATKVSNNVFVIPAATSYTTIVNIDNAKTNEGVGNSSHFGRYIRIKYSENTGITRQLQYSTSPTFANSVSSISISGTTSTDVDLNSLTRGTQYYFRVVYTCNTKTTYSSSTSLTRANDITPNITSISPTSGTYVKPYTDSSFSFTFTNSPIAWNSDNDVGSTYRDIYSTKLVYTSRDLTITTSEQSHSSGTVARIAALVNTVTTWANLISGSTVTAPMGTYTLTLSITATNLFGETFTGTKSFTVDFRENPSFNSQPILQIKTGSSPDTYTEIPTSSNRYPLFANQTIRYNCPINSIYSYVDQPATLKFYKGDTLLTSQSISKTDWTYNSDLNKYRLNTTKNLDYTIPTITTQDNNVNFKVQIVYNNYTSYYADSNEDQKCKLMKINTSEIQFSIISASESNPQITLNYIYNNNGAISNSTYSSQIAQFKYSNSPSGTYENFGSSVGVNTSSSSQSKTDSSSSISGDIIYFGVTLTLTAAFENISVENVGVVTPTGNKIYTATFTNLYTFYRQTPNLGYGKNFFFLNQNAPISGRTDQLLEISTAQYTNNDNLVIRDKIYFGTDGSNLQITNSGLIIDCGSWD